MEFVFRNVNEAFRGLVDGVASGRIPTRRETSRAGDVLRIPEPVLVAYERPWERVLFNPARDCNPFFHLLESFWMLRGARDVKTVAWANSRMKEFSDDGNVFHGAYGYRWRNHFGFDQLADIIDELLADPGSRRVVLQIWDCRCDLGRRIVSRDKPCNTQAYFAIREEKTPHNWPPEKLQRKIAQEYEMAGLARKDGDITDSNQRLKRIEMYRQGYATSRAVLDMTVCNRSNDMIWGMLGANVVHFSFLQEYIAQQVGVSMGRYYQFTNNLHVYTKRWKPEVWEPFHCDYYVSTIETVPIGETFNRDVVFPMLMAFGWHKRRDYDRALNRIERVEADDWRLAGTTWLCKRRDMYASRTSTEQD
jgi:hypothetical protein